MKTMNGRKWVMAGLLIIAAAVANAQPGGMIQHNSSASESIDSVTVGSTLEYFAMPDLNINQDGDGPYDYATNSDALISTFVWSSDGGETATESAENLASFTWNTTNVLRTVSVTESAGGCDGTPVTFQVRVIDAPEAGFTAAAGSEDFCETGADGALTVSPSAMDVTINSDVIGAQDVIISYQITSTASGFSTVNNTASIAEGATSFSISENLTHYGTYTIEITDVTDRISRKPATDVSGTVLANATFTVNVNRTPSTGGIYRLPNM